MGAGGVCAAYWLSSAQPSLQDSKLPCPWVAPLTVNWTAQVLGLESAPTDLPAGQSIQEIFLLGVSSSEITLALVKLTQMDAASLSFEIIGHS